jgi:hypothetical protein
MKKLVITAIAFCFMAVAAPGFAAPRPVTSETHTMQTKKKTKATHSKKWNKSSKSSKKATKSSKSKPKS